MPIDNTSDQDSINQLNIHIEKLEEKIKEMEAEKRCLQEENATLSGKLYAARASRDGF